MTAVVYTAETGLNYRKYRQGKIDKKTFWRKTRVHTASTLGGVAGGIGGAAAGFALGTLIFPGVGSLIGSLAGGIAGGMGASAIS